MKNYFGPAVVTQVFLTDSSHRIRVQALHDASGTSVSKIVFPLYSNVEKIPLEGEVVDLYYNIDQDHSRFSVSTKLYYTEPLNISDSNVHNSLERPNLTNNNFDYKTILPIQRFDGDTVISSRMGASLRFTSTLPSKQPERYSKNPKWTKGISTNGQPLVILTSGQTFDQTNSEDVVRIEDINRDRSILALTSGQNMGMVLSFAGDLKPLVSSKNQILLDGNPNTSEAILNSGRIIINSKTSDVTISAASTLNLLSNSPTTILSKESTYIGSKRIFLGKSAMTSHSEDPSSTSEKLFSRAVKGEAFIEILNEVIDLSIQVAGKDERNSSVVLRLEKLKNKLKKALSQTVFLE